MPNGSKSNIEVVASHLRENGLFYAVGLVTALGLKHYYSSAAVDGLGWILAPIAKLAGLLGGMDFQWEPGTGFVNLPRKVVIAPACAGVNFLIICFSTIFFTFVGRLRGAGAKWTWFGASLAVSYLVTLCTNAIRIVISINLYDTPIYSGWITPERVHRLAGTVIYLCVLVVVFLAIERFVRHVKKPGRPLGQGFTPIRTTSGTLMAPLAWYALVTLLIPLLNGAAVRNGYRFAEHAALVMAASLGIFLLPGLVAAVRKKRVDILNKTQEKVRDSNVSSEFLKSEKNWRVIA